MRAVNPELRVPGPVSRISDHALQIPNPASRIPDHPLQVWRAVTSVFVAIALLAGSRLFQPPAAFAQDEPDEQEAAGALDRQAQLARDFTDPLTTLPQIFLKDAYTPSNYGTDAQTNRVILRAIVPRISRFSWFPFVQLVRPSFFLNTVPTGKGSATRTEFGDMQLFDVAVLPWPGRETGLMMAVGPTFAFPTATDKSAGQGAWQVGPAFGAVYKGIPWLLMGGLIQNPISFAYTSDDRRAVSTLFVQPVLLLNVTGGWYVKSGDATWSFHWHHGGATLVPLSFGIGRVIVREGYPPVNFFVSGEWMAYRRNAPVAPQTTINFGATMAFPQWQWRRE